MMNFLLLSAGWGTRLRPLTFYRPKALIPVRGKPCLLTCYEVLSRAFSPKAVYVNTHALSPWFGRFFEKLRLKNWRILYEPKILGSGGTIMHCLTSLTDRWLVVMNSDTFLYPQNCGWLSHLVPEANAIILVVSSKPGLNNVVIDEKGAIVRFRSDRLTPDEEDRGYRLVAFTGIHLLDKNLAEKISWGGKYADIINLYAQLLKSGRIRTFECPSSSWHDIGSLERYLEVHEGGDSRNFWSGSGVLVEADCMVEDVIAWDDVIIKAGSSLKGCIITDGAEVSGSFQKAVITPLGVFPIEPYHRKAF